MPWNPGLFGKRLTHTNLWHSREKFLNCFMFEKFVRGFVLLLKAEVLMWIILLVIAGMIYLVGKFW